MDDAGRQAPLRIALSVTSAASLGAFEAGAVAALLTAVQRLNTRAAEQERPAPVRLDAVGATSAGALVGLLATRCLLAGIDPAWTLHQAWVDRASFRRLARHRQDAPLSLHSVRADLGSLLDPRDRRGRPKHRVPAIARQECPVRFSVALGCLQGLTYEIPEVGGDPSIGGMTHVDWADLTFRPDDELGDYDDSQPSAIDSVLASMSHPAAFAPRVLDRSRERSRYLEDGVTNFPDSGHLWYCDGSALLTRPFARTLAAARSLDGDDPTANRVHVLVHPHTGAPGPRDEWTNPDQRPSWPSTVSRLLALLTTEALYDDMREIEQVNARVRWSSEVADVLGRHLPDEAAPELADLLRRIRGDRTGLRAIDAEERADKPLPGGLAALAAELVGEASGTAGRTHVRTEVVSPMRWLAADDADAQTARRQHEVRSLLAGEFLGRFGGFADRDLRQSDFVLGWRSCQMWLPDALRRGGLDEADVSAAVAAVEEKDVSFGPSGPRGGASVRDLPLVARARLVRLVLWAAGVAVRDATKRRG